MRKLIWENRCYALVLGALLLWVSCSSAIAISFIEEHPQLKEYRFKEPASNLFFGVGMSPFSIMNNGVQLSVSAFQLHYIKDELDLELLSANLGFTLTKSDLSIAHKAILRTVPKLKISQVLSLGVLLGAEFIDFPNVNTKIYSGSKITPNFEPFSQFGFIYGLAASQTFVLNETFQLRVNEFVYQESYSTSTSSNGWSIYYQDPGLQSSTAPINSSTVVALEFCLLF